MSRKTTDAERHHIRQRDRHRGHSLIELCACLVIVAVLATAAAPNMQQWQQRHQAERFFFALHHTLQYARQHAVLTNHPVTICPLNAQRRCHNNWQDPISVFEDRNRNRQLEHPERLLQYIPAVPDNSQRHYWRDAITFDEKGFAGFTNGTLSHCFRQNDTYSATIITISRLGRARIQTAHQQHQHPQNSQGQDIPCH